MGIPSSEAAKSYVQSVLAKNAHLNFVNRHLHPGVFPVLNNPDGSFSSQSMASGEVDGRYVVYPTVVQRPGERDLVRLVEKPGQRDALNYAMKTGEFIEFPTEAEAQWFSNDNYKRGSIRDPWAKPK